MTRKSLLAKETEEEPPPVQAHDEVDARAAWGLPAGKEPLWYPAVAIVVALVLWIKLPSSFALPYPYFWIVPTLEAAAVGPILFARHRTPRGRRQWTRVLTICLIASINVTNIISLGELIERLLGHGSINATDLLFSAISIWFTNVIVFGLWYWELDRGGPYLRRTSAHRQPDFLFPQMATPYSAPKDWSPDFVDYLYTSFTNATAFSPTDTMPLTNWAKLLMMLQAFASLVTVALVAARAVNILH